MKRSFYTLILGTFCFGFVNAGNTDAPRNVIFVNSDVTTHLIMPENLRTVDISTPIIAGDQCTDNMVRIKPVALDTLTGKPFKHYDFMGTITLIGERHMVQYDLLYETEPTKANSFHKIGYEDAISYSNPEIAMPESEMANLAWTIYGSKRKFNNIHAKKYGINAEVFNIYSIGNYFFIDFCLKNSTKIPYNINEIRVNLTDKKESKATNYQTVELTPAYVLNNAKSFNKGYRQVLVLEKLTFPNEKVLNIEIAEDQISGRVITLPIEYEDILNADCFNLDKTRPNREVRYVENNDKAVKNENYKLQKELKDAKDQMRLYKTKYDNLKNSIKAL